LLQRNQEDVELIVAYSCETVCAMLPQEWGKKKSSRFLGAIAAVG